jgi:hypothetical protein
MDAMEEMRSRGAVSLPVSPSVLSWVLPLPRLVLPRENEPHSGVGTSYPAIQRLALPHTVTYLCSPREGEKCPAPC